MSQPAIFLDRDNTLIHNDGDLGDPAEVRLIQGAASAVASLCGLGYKIVVITNQGGVARGKYSEDDVNATHQHLARLVQKTATGGRIDRFYYCPYHPQGSVEKYKRDHPNRKPQPGMLLDAARDMNLDLARSWTIGDQACDIEAGIAAGTRTILLSGEHHQSSKADYRARTLIEAVRIIAQQRNPAAVESAIHARSGKQKWDADAVAELQKTSIPQTLSSPPPPSEKSFRPWNVPPEISPPPEAPQETSPEDIPETPPEAPPSSLKPQASSLPDPDPNLLKQILQELRRQRGSDQHETSWMSVTAIVMQMVAGVCLLGGLWMGAADYELFMRWTLTGLMIQGATIALLLFAHRR